MSSNVRALAKEVGCSPATVSRVLNDYPYVKPELRKRIIRAAQKHNYSLYRNCFLVIIPENAFFSGYLGLILQELQIEASRRNYHLSIATEQDLAFTSGAHLFDGVISLQGRIGLEKRWSSNEVLPMVCINSIGKADDNILRVSSNNKQGIFLALDHLKANGHRRIAFIAPDIRQPEDATDTQERQKFYKQWMQKNCPEIEPLISAFPFSETGRSKRILMLKELIQQGITAFLVPGEGVSTPLYYHLNLLNIKIPEDISIVGMEHDHVSFALSPAETTIGQNWSKLAQGAFDVLEKIHSKAPVHDLSIPFLLNDRGSVRNLNRKDFES